MASPLSALDAFRYDGTRTKKQAPFDLAAIDPAARPLGSGDKARDRERVEALAVELDRLQGLLYADRRFSVLVVLQGMDTSGKDGTARDVFGRMSPLGVRSVAWKAPTEEERAHDFLWRIHRAVPGAGDVVIFNRSHYEDVLVPVVERSITPREARARHAHINSFEQLLVESNTVVLKFLLHISKDEQRARLQARIDDPEKRWKFRADDLTVRAKWGAYQRAYQQAVLATGTRDAPWTVVPADSKTQRNLVVASVVVDALQKLGLRYPKGEDGIESLRVN